ncbi:MAG: prohibitin family protein [Acidimicrobiia bacterium]|nr:prohibitin family protein [Acidimicrobiia bacterium]
MHAIIDHPPSSRWSRLRNRVRAFVLNHGFGIAITSLIVLFAVVFFWRSIVHTVNPGEAAVSWKRFSGTQIDKLYLEGTHFIWPWNKIYIYDLRIQKVDTKVPVLSTDGLEINIDVSIRYRAEERTLPQLHKEVGADYPDRIVIPHVVSSVREVFGKYRPEQLYTLRADDVHDQLLTRASKGTRERFVLIDDVIISRIELPEAVQKAIQSKLTQEQEALAYEYRLVTEQREAERKKIEATGIAEFQRAVAPGLSQQYLQWRGIQATLELAKSNNAKLVIVGGKDGLPIILNTPDIANAPPPQPR